MKKLIIIIVFIITTGFTTNRVEALIQKEVNTTFSIETFTKKNIEIPSEIKRELPCEINNENFFEIHHNNSLKGYYYLGKAYGKADYFDFIVIFDQNLIISKVSVLVYREDHGGEVGSKRWLKQFNGKDTSKALVYQEDISGISGATISVKSMTNEINKLLKTINILHLKQLL